MSATNRQFVARLRDAAENRRANPKLRASGFSIPILCPLFLRYADMNFAGAVKQIAGKVLADLGARTATP